MEQTKAREGGSPRSIKKYLNCDPYYDDVSKARKETAMRREEESSVLFYTFLLEILQKA